MTAIEQAIKEAVMEGNYCSEALKIFGLKGVLRARNNLHRAETLLDPLFWQALGKARGWEKKVVVRRGTVIGNFCTPCSAQHPRGECFEEMGFDMDYLNPWAYHWHRFIDHLAEGKDSESFFVTLV